MFFNLYKNFNLFFFENFIAYWVFPESPQILNDNIGLQQICEKIRTSVEKEETLFDNQKISVTLSGGVCFSNESSSVSDLVNKADERLYLAKKNGRNKFYLKEE